MASVENFVRDYRVAIDEVLDALEKIETMKKQAVALDYPSTLADDFANNEDLQIQNPDIGAQDLINATLTIDAIWDLLNANDYLHAARLYTVRV